MTALAALLIAWTLTITPYDTSNYLKAALQLASKGHCVRVDFQQTDDVLLCRTKRGTPHYCVDVTISEWMDYRIMACERFNER